MNPRTFPSVRVPILYRALVIALSLAGCNSAGSAPSAPSPAQDAAVSIPLVPVAALPGHSSLSADNSPKESQRMVPPESLIRTYLSLFGGLAPLDLQARLRSRTPGGASQGLFDTWDDYLSALGVPDYTVDIPRGTQTNALMVAAFERIGVALCDRAVEHDMGTPTPDVTQRLVFAFDLPATPTMSDTDFATRFDVLHRTFLGYPAALAQTDRVNRFRTLYQSTVASHMAAGSPASLFTPAQAGWAAVCYGLIRHPEFHLY